MSSALDTNIHIIGRGAQAVKMTANILTHIFLTLARKAKNQNGTVYGIGFKFFTTSRDLLFETSAHSLK
jgi:hypothetical protein